MNAFESLAETMRTLRSANGCPWDKAQSLESLKSYLIEEAYEVLDAIDADQPEEHLEELGDLLFQIVFQSQIRSEQGQFEFEDVARTIDNKMRRRHPHVFGGLDVESADVVTENWDKLKQTERENQKDQSRFAGIPRHLPALLRAQRLGEKAQRFGLDWPNTKAVWSKVNEELEELQEAVNAQDARATAEEMGDVIFTLVSIARHLGLDAESCLMAANQKFERRARFVEQAVPAEGAVDPEHIDRLWKGAKNRG